VVAVLTRAVGAVMEGAMGAAMGVAATSAMIDLPPQSEMIIEAEIIPLDGMTTTMVTDEIEDTTIMAMAVADVHDPLAPAMDAAAETTAEGVLALMEEVETMASWIYPAATELKSLICRSYCNPTSTVSSRPGLKVSLRPRGCVQKSCSCIPVCQKIR
jgi:hypothetical protein